MVLEAILQIIGAILWPTRLPRAKIIPSWAHLGPILDPSWGHLGGPLGLILGLSWALLGLLGLILGPSWALLGHLMAFLARSGAMLGYLVTVGGLPSHFSGHVGLSCDCWGILGHSSGHLGLSCDTVPTSSDL